MYRDFRPIAVLDWEMAALSPRELDLSYCVYIHWMFQDAVQRYGGGAGAGMPHFMRPSDALTEYERTHRLHAARLRVLRAVERHPLRDDLGAHRTSLGLLRRDAGARRSRRHDHEPRRHRAHARRHVLEGSRLHDEPVQLRGEAGRPDRRVLGRRRGAPRTARRARGGAHHRASTSRNRRARRRSSYRPISAARPRSTPPIAEIEGPVHALFNNAGVAGTMPVEHGDGGELPRGAQPHRGSRARMPEGSAVAITASIAGAAVGDPNLAEIQELLDGRAAGTNHSRGSTRIPTCSPTPTPCRSSSCRSTR